MKSVGMLSLVVNTIDVRRSMNIRATSHLNYSLVFVLVLFSYGWIISFAHFLNFDCCYVVRSERSICNKLIIESSLNSVRVFF
jgi:hypothetical protein